MSIWSYIPEYIQAISVAVAAGFAVWSVNAWRRETIGKRRSEIAEQAIVAASSVEDAFEYVRSPFGFGGEGQTRRREDDENEEVSDALDRDFVPIERMKNYIDEFSQLKSVMLLCKAHFGEEAIEPINELLRIHIEIINAAKFRMIISRNNQQYSERQEELYFRKENIIWDQGDEDEINPRVKKALSDIEEYYGKFLKA